MSRYVAELVEAVVAGDTQLASLAIDEYDQRGKLLLCEVEGLVEALHDIGEVELASRLVHAIGRYLGVTAERSP